MELYHHGRKGQHWGVTNGPPYPLDMSNKAYKYQSKLNKQDRKASKYVKKYEISDKKVVRMQDKLENKGSNNVSYGFEKRLNRIVNSREKYSDAVQKIDTKTKKTVANILKKGYDITMSDVIRGKYRNPGGLRRTAVWGHEYSVEKSDDKRGTLTSYSGQATVNRSLNTASSNRKKIPFSSIK